MKVYWERCGLPLAPVGDGVGVDGVWTARGSELFRSLSAHPKIQALSIVTLQHCVHSEERPTLRSHAEINPGASWVSTS